ncbi:MAG TPA: VWA domain-containing protein [Bryobacteraceae bacterium]
MTFTHPWLLLLLILPGAWVALSWRSTRRRVPLVLKGLSLAAILGAFAEPVMILPQTKIAEVVLIDTSASIDARALQSASATAQTILERKGRNWVKIVPFENGIRNLRPAELAGSLHLEPVSLEQTTGTNLEAALTGSMAAIPAGYLPRLLLISDGNENEGSTVRAIAQMQSLQVPVDTIPVGGKPGPELRLESVSLPQEAYSGEEIPLAIDLTAPAATSAVLDIHAENKVLGHQTVDLHAGRNTVRANVRIKSSGIAGIAGKLTTPAQGEVRFEDAIRLRRARVLYLSDDPAGADSNLLSALTQANMEISRDAGELDKDLSAFELVILNNLDLNSISLARKAKLEEYVKNGGGLLLIGGERQVYKEDKQMDALDRALPAKLAPPDIPKGTCVALIIDKSSSMEGRKIELARLSAIGVVDHLRPSDTIGVLIFDNSFQWAVPMRRAEDKSLIKRLISGITPDGGTQIAPALTEAYHRVVPSNATYKHIVLLTDGISEEGDSIDLAREAAQHDITISTVGLGQDVNRSYLEKVAATSGGRSYFLNEPAGLEQILLKDVETYSGSTAIEKALTPIVAEKSDVLENVDMENAPPLRGYARFIAKPGADTLLAINKARRDPLYVRWQYGLGRAAVFTSDAKSRWAQAWVSWPGFDKFWTNLARDLLLHTTPSEAVAGYDSANGDLIVSYRLASETREPAPNPVLYVLGPKGFHETIELKKSADRFYQGRLHVGALTGLFRVRPETESPAFPEIGLYRNQPELDDRGVNDSLLKEISQATGGRYNPTLSEVFDTGGRRNWVSWQLWPACLAFAVALGIAELIARKWSGLIGRVFRPALRAA